MKRTKLSMHQRGETIMEVLICTTVVALITSAAFALSNRNQAYARAAQERGTANTIAETQLEFLRNYADDLTLPTLDPSPDTAFCITEPIERVVDAGVKVNKLDIKWFNTAPAATPPLDVQSDNDLNKYPNDCKYTTGENEAPKYRFAVWPPGTATSVVPGDDRYMITVRWDSATGDGIDQIQLYYEIHSRLEP